MGEKLTGLDMAREAARLALDKKAISLKALDLQGLVTYTDYFVICSGESTPQVKAIVDNVEEGLRKRNVHPRAIEGRAHAHWVLMDYGDVIVHVFEKETRDFYELEKLWLDAPEIEIEGAERSA